MNDLKLAGSSTAEDSGALDLPQLRNHIIQVEANKASIKFAACPHIGEKLIFCTSQVHKKTAVYKWFDEKASRVQNLRTIYAKIAEASPPLTISLRFAGVCPEEVKMIMEAPEFEKMNVVALRESDSGVVQIVMDHSRRDVKISTEKSVRIPVDFRHEKIFNYLSARYSDARFVQLTDLLQIRDMEEIGLGESNVTELEARQFFHHMLTSDHQIVKKAEMILKSYQRVNMVNLMLGYVSIVVTKMNEPILVVRLRDAQNSKIGLVQTTQNLVRFWIFDDVPDALEAMKMVEERQKFDEDNIQPDEQQRWDELNRKFAEWRIGFGRAQAYAPPGALESLGIVPY